MKRPMIRIEKGTLVRNKYAFEADYGVTTSKIEYHSPPSSTPGKVIQYVWVLWNNGEHCLFKVDMLEVINEGR
tara:strand:- start:214 stop:432 length:219 start_codon:yes stop_codon:yes gene_type:complete